MPWLAGLLLLSQCGSRPDLVLGVVAASEPGGAGDARAASAGDAATGGASTGTMGGGPGAAGQDASGASGAPTVAGSPDEMPDDCSVGEEPPTGSLVHRYSFEGVGAVAFDSVGGADGKIHSDAGLDGSGTLVLQGDNDYLDLPNGVVSALNDVTVVAWTRWSGEGPAWQRIFDFGVSSAEGERDGGRSYFCLMASTGFDDQRKHGLGGEMKVPGFETVTLASTENMAQRTAQVAFSFKGGESAALYLDGVRLARQSTAIEPSNIVDVNDWVGQSQYGADVNYAGSYEELRIYAAALNGCQLHTLLVRGPQWP